MKAIRKWIATGVAIVSLIVATVGLFVAAVARVPGGSCICQFSRVRHNWGWRWLGHERAGFRVPAKCEGGPLFAVPVCLEQMD